jgi:hypothetical protein
MKCLIKHGAVIDEKRDVSEPVCSQSFFCLFVEMIMKQDTMLLIVHFWIFKVGATPLYVAAQFGKVEAMQLLIEHGADIHAKRDVSISALKLVILLVIKCWYDNMCF